MIILHHEKSRRAKHGLWISQQARQLGGPQLLVQHLAVEDKSTRLPCDLFWRYPFEINRNEIVTIQTLYPTLNSAELAEAELKLSEYLRIVTRIFDRLDQEEGGASAKIHGTLSCTTPGSGSSGNHPPK